MKKGEILFVVIAYYLGDKNNKSYVVFITNKLEVAKRIQKSHDKYRGSKYICSIEEIKYSIENK